MKLLFALPGFHRFHRGAEVALLSIARELARLGDQVTVMGSGPDELNELYTYRRISSVRREFFESFPTFPPLRTETCWEDLTFGSNLALRHSLSIYDATVTCSFPFTHWALRKHGGRGPAHIFVTQNGDWPASSNQAEYRFFECDGLVCTNPDYLERNAQTWRSVLVPNGVDLSRFKPGASTREQFDLPRHGQIVLMVSALIGSKRVLEGIRAVAALENVFLVVAGDGPLRSEANNLAQDLLPGRFRQISVPAGDMPELYRSADAFLHMSLLESFGNVFLEAWATGLPIVAHDSPRLRWILGNEGFLCDTEDPLQTISFLKAALARGRDMNPVGVDHYSWPNIALRYRSFIADVVADRRRKFG